MGKRGLEKTPEEIRLLKKVGSKIRSLAARKGVSIEQLTYEGGVSRGYLYDLVNGQGNPSLVILYRIAQTLEVPLGKLLP